MTLDTSLNELQTSITANYNAIATLSGLQNNDITSFNAIDTSLNDLYTTKQNVIDVNNKLDASNINRDDNLQYIDITNPLQAQLSTLQTNIDTKQNVIDVNNKVLITNVDLATSSLANVDITTPLQALQINSILGLPAKLSEIDTNLSSIVLNDGDISLNTYNILQNANNITQNTSDTCYAKLYHL